MSDNSVEHINKTYKGHRYSLTLKYAQEHGDGGPAHRYLVVAETLVDGQPVFRNTKGFKEVLGDPEQAVRDYIDYLVSDTQSV